MFSIIAFTYSFVCIFIDFFPHNSVTLLKIIVSFSYSEITERYAGVRKNNLNKTSADLLACDAEAFMAYQAHSKVQQQIMSQWTFVCSKQGSIMDANKLL